MGTTVRAILSLVWMGCAAAQTPTGFIAGVVRDPSGAAVPAAQIKLESKSNAVARTVKTSATGDYSFSALPVGVYEVTVDCSGFRQAVRQAAVEAGTTTTTDFTL